MIKRLLCIFGVLLLTGCSPAKPVDNVVQNVELGFLTLDGNGIAEHPFSDDAKYTVEWTEKPSWTALPIMVSGELEGTVLSDATASSYSYTMGTTDEADAYYTVITAGYQERFEDLWTDIYDIMNGVEEYTSVDSTVLSDALSTIHGDEKYGYLQDILTEALVVVKDMEESGPSDELNIKAGEVYNQFYGWLYSFSTDSLQNK